MISPSSNRLKSCTSCTGYIRRIGVGVGIGIGLGLGIGIGKSHSLGWLPAGALALVIVTILLAPTPTHAQPLDGIVKEASSGNSFAASSPMTLKEATELARKERGGRVLSAKSYRRSGTNGYEVRLLIDGERVVNVIVDSDGRVRNKK